MMKKSILSAALTACIVAIAGCDDARRELPPPPTITGNLLLLTDNNELASINVDKSDELISKESIKGLKTGDSLIGIDYRPADGKLYAVGYLGNIYTIDTATTTAEFKIALKADPADTTAPFSILTGDKAQMALDFNPVADRMRIVGNDGQNLRINVDTGLTTTDGVINGADATVTSAAYTNSFIGTASASTRLFDIDVKQDRLFLQNPPNDGVLSTSATLGVTATASSGFDIDGANNDGFAVLTVGGVQELYSINLASIGTTTKAATLKGKLPALGNILGISLKFKVYVANTAVGLTNNNQLAIFSPSAPNKVVLKKITGLDNEELIVGIDYRLRTTAINKDGSSKADTLYALSNKGNLYILNENTGAASDKLPLVPATDDTTLPFAALSSGSFAVDFNPVADRLRVISDTGQNLHINVDNGQVTTDTALNGIPAAQVSAAAYSNSFAGGTVTATQLFNLDRSTNQLLLQEPPNDGKLTAVGALGISLGNATGFDIAGGDNGVALAVINSGTTNSSALYKVNLTTGAVIPAIIVGTPDQNLAASKIGDDKTPIPALIDIAIF
jgi:hypothetical protein